MAMLLTLVIPLITTALVRKRLSGAAAFLCIVVVSSLAIYGLIVAQWWTHNGYLEQQIAPLDRDGDGFWSDAEKATWTEQDHRHMAAYIGDGGRNVFALWVAPVWALLYSTVVAAVNGLIRR